LSTSVEEQLKRQVLWKPRKSERIADRARTLLKSEFQDQQEKQQEIFKGLAAVIQFCKDQVPFYSSSFKNKEFLTTGDLQKLPILTKQHLQHKSTLLVPRSLPNGHKAGGVRQSSGTTGQPVKIPHTAFSNEIFTIIKQREYRWFNFNPINKLAVIRLPSQLPYINGAEITFGQTFSSPGWGSLSNHYQTGEFVAFSVLNTIEDQLKWIEKIKPHYLTAYAESLEHLAFAATSNDFSFQMQSLLSISETMTSDMRNRITNAFSAPIQQNYGLNELGIIASKCPEGDRYHVHSEFYHVEIINKEGYPCQPGKTGKIIVTSLSNPAMPLIRYDTDDLAIATDQQCPCGRSLPCFGEVVGRYSRIAYLPEGTLGNVGVIREILASLPSDQTKWLRRFQIHQNISNSFELRLVASKKLEPSLFTYIKNSWNQHKITSKISFKVTQISQLNPEKNGKYHDFTSDFMP